jgi:RimJ/RimL family protein N-acetyltransferase
VSYFLQSSRLGFRSWTSGDLALAFSLWGDPAVTAWLNRPLTAEEVRARLEREIRMQEEFGLQYWPVFLLATGDFAGCAGLRLKTEGLLELGYYLKPAVWGGGLATEAAAAVAGYAFGTLHVETLFAGHHPANGASQRILEKLGFERSGEEFYEPSNVIEPTYLLQRARWAQNNHQSSASAQP